MSLFDNEQSFRESGCANLCGVDEAGRGPLAGPVFAAAVILPSAFVISGINDSKKLSDKRRETLYDEITANALSYCIVSSPPEEIDRINILQATLLCMRRAVEGLKVAPDLVLIDGNRMPQGLTRPAQTVVKGDATYASIAAASILAKVARDRFMMELAREYPAYRFEQHKGYPTKLHYEMIKQYGILPCHRKSFLRNLGEK